MTMVQWLRRSTTEIARHSRTGSYCSSDVISWWLYWATMTNDFVDTSLISCLSIHTFAHLFHYKETHSSPSVIFNWNFLLLFTARRSDASAVLGIVILSVCLSVCLSRALWQNQTMHFGYFDTTRKENHASFLRPTVVRGRCSLQSEICAQWPIHPFEKRRLRQSSAYNVSTVRDSEKLQLWRIGSRPRSFQRFQRTVDGVRSKSDFCFLNKIQFIRIKSATKFLCVKTSSGKVVVQPFPV